MKQGKRRKVAKITMIRPKVLSAAVAVVEASRRRSDGCSDHEALTFAMGRLSALLELLVEIDPYLDEFIAKYSARVCRFARCGRLFIPHHDTQVYHSLVCGENHRSQTYRERRKAGAPGRQFLYRRPDKR